MKMKIVYILSPCSTRLGHFCSWKKKPNTKLVKKIVVNLGKTSFLFLLRTGRSVLVEMLTEHVSLCLEMPEVVKIWQSFQLKMVICSYKCQAPAVIASVLAGMKGFPEGCDCLCFHPFCGLAELLCSVGASGLPARCVFVRHPGTVILLQCI